MSCREKRAGDADADADADEGADEGADDGAGKCTLGGAALACAAYSARRVSRLCSACASRWLL